MLAGGGPPRFWGGPTPTNKHHVDEGYPDVASAAINSGIASVTVVGEAPTRDSPTASAGGVAAPCSTVDMSAAANAAPLLCAYPRRVAAPLR
ncbi:hypothetical protein cyc_07330 [Cyclospora cayetanensis]|uniref:Uncharacterized protein n=1 Tax=Cyclospora cayetanensis TaxID=88456 RepID=A0A1D3D648_9EIME|nr:hypothetical protein cyc_07330 [Cyclospora cayetanensis]